MYIFFLNLPSPPDPFSLLAFSILGFHLPRPLIAAPLPHPLKINHIRTDRPSFPRKRQAELSSDTVYVHTGLRGGRLRNMGGSAVFGCKDCQERETVSHVFTSLPPLFPSVNIQALWREAFDNVLSQQMP